MIVGVKRKWELIIQKELLDIDWGRLSSFAVKFSSNLPLCDNHFKVLLQWYSTPNRLAKIFPGSLATCWHCGNPGVYMVDLQSDSTFLEDYQDKTSGDIGIHKSPLSLKFFCSVIFRIGRME